MSNPSVNAASDPPEPENFVAPDGDDLLSLLDSLRRDGFPIGVKEYITAQEIAIACNDDNEPTRLRNWLAPVLCTNPDEQRLFYQRFADWWAQKQPPAPTKPQPQPVRTELDKDIQKARPWKWVILATVLIAAAVLVPPLLKQPMLTQPGEVPPPPGPGPDSGPVQKPGTEPPAPVDQEKLGPQKIITGMVTDTQGRGIEGATVAVELELKGHSRPINSIVFSPDGTQALTASYDNTARIWNVIDGRELALLKHDNAVISARFSPDGTRVITASEDKTARLWDAANGNELESFMHTDIVSFAVFRQDGSQILTLSHDKTARIWDVSSGLELTRLKHDSDVHYGMFSPDGRSILTTSDDKAARIWNAADGKELEQLIHDNSVISARFSPDGSRILTRSKSNTAQIWSVSNGSVQSRLEHKDTLRSALFSHDGSRVLTTSWDNTARIWDVIDGQEIARLNHDKAVNFGMFSQDDNRVLTASNDNSVRIWDTEGGQEQARLMHEGSVLFAVFSPVGELLASNSRDTAKRLHWDPAYIYLLGPKAPNSRDTAKLLLWTVSDSSGNFRLASSLTDNTQLQISHPDTQTATLQQTPDGNGELTVAAQLSPLPALWMKIFLRNRDLTRISLTLLPLLIVSAWWLWRRNRRQLILERRSVRNVDALAGIAIPEPPHDLYRDESFVRARIEARRHQACGQGDLDADATVDETVRQLGWFTPVYKKRLRLPAYLALIDRHDFRDQQARMMDEFFDRLEEGGVSVDRYYFDRDPRMCLTALHGDGTRRALRELAGRYPQHRLLLFTDGSGLLNPVTGRPANWVELLSAWQERALMTPVPVSSWSSREVELARLGCNVLPATTAGLLAFVDQLDETDKVELPKPTDWSPPFPELITANPTRWLQRDEPNKEDSDELLQQVQSYLGDDGYRWLCALAVYPELDWYLTLYIGLKLHTKNAQPVLDETTLLSLVRLPWLRRGNIPDWLRLRLITDLSSEDENTVRGFLRELLRAPLEAPGSRFHLDIAQPSDTIQRRGWTRFFTDLLRTEPDDSPLQDRVFVNFLLGKRPLRLQVLAPRNWHRLVYERGIGALGFNNGAAILLAIITSVALAGGAFPLLDLVETLQQRNSEGESQIEQLAWKPADEKSKEKKPLKGKQHTSGLYSGKTSQSTRITFVNAGKSRVNINWVNFDGGETHYFSLAAGETRVQQTYVTHSWIARETGSQRQVYSVIAAVKPMTVRIGDNSSLKAQLVGRYENHQYDEAGKNDWHYVTLSDEGGENLRWTNRAGVSWELKTTDYSDQLTVGKDSPYYAKGDSISKVDRNKDGTVNRISGPGGEWYERVWDDGEQKQVSGRPEPDIKDVFVERFGGGTGIRYSARNLKLFGAVNTIRLRRGGKIKASLEINHDCRECGGAINQIIVGLAGENKAQACVWNGGQSSRGWQTVSFTLNIPDAPGNYDIRSRYAQAYNCKDAIGWWKIDRAKGPGEQSTIGRVIVEAASMKTGMKKLPKKEQPKAVDPGTVLNNKWKKNVLPFYRKRIEYRYPFSPKSSTDVELKNFATFFGNDGILQRFIEQDLAPYLDTSGAQWRWRDKSPGFSDYVLDELQRADRIRQAFFQDGGKEPLVRFSLKPSRLDKESARFILELDEQRFQYAHGPKISKKLQWPGSNNPARARYVFEDLNGKTTSVTKEGPWAWFRLLEEARVSVTRKKEQLNLTFSENKLYASFDLQTNRGAIDFKNDLANFRCPQHLFVSEGKRLTSKIKDELKIKIDAQKTKLKDELKRKSKTKSVY